VSGGEYFMPVVSIAQIKNKKLVKICVNSWLKYFNCVSPILKKYPHDFVMMNKFDLLYDKI